MAWVGKTQRLWREKHNSFRPMGKMQQLLVGNTKVILGEKTIVLVGKLLRVIPTLINVRISINLGNGLYPSAPKVE
jgi:hypothetical protein